jgi:NADPH-dependent curcumin reductase CurA
VPRQIVLVSRPSGWPTEDNFAVTEAARPELTDGQVRVRNLFMSVDPYMRGRMNDTKSYVPPFQLGEPLQGGAIGSVVETRSPDLAEGDLVLHNLGWRDEAVLPAGYTQKIAATEGLSPSACSTSPRSSRATWCSSPARPARWAAWPARSPSSRAPPG